MSIYTILHLNDSDFGPVIDSILNPYPVNKFLSLKCCLPFTSAAYTVNLVLVSSAKNKYFSLCTIKNYFLGKCHCTN